MTGSAAGRLAPPVLVALILAVFANATGGVFVFDDIADILQNDSAKAATFVERLAAMNRPLTKASYVANWLFSPLPAGFAIAGVAMHVSLSELRANNLYSLAAASTTASPCSEQHKMRCPSRIGEL